MLGSELAHGVGPPCFTDGAKAGHVGLADAKGVRTEDLAGGEIDDALDPTAVVRRTKHVHRALERDLHRDDGVLEHGVDACDRGKVDDIVAPRHRSADGSHVSDVAHDQLDVWVVVEPCLREGVAAQDVEDSNAVVVCESLGQRGTDETGTAGDQDMCALQHSPLLELAQMEPTRRESPMGFTPGLAHGTLVKSGDGKVRPLA